TDASSKRETNKKRTNLFRLSFFLARVFDLGRKTKKSHNRFSATALSALMGDSEV
ncbi:unnamed protein product, partial [Brassica rapa subsp. trilocularis]